MGLFNRGQSISGMWLDGKPAIRAYLGDVLVWDGTMPAFVNVPRALASALAVAPTVRADASITAVYALGSSSAIAPSLTAFATVDPETAVIVTAQASAPVVRADSIIMVETITVGAQALPAVAAQSSSAAVEVPSISVSVNVPTPTVAAHFATTVPAIAVNATAQVPVITATGAAVVNVPVSAVNAMARVPAVSGNSSVGAFAVTADSTAKIPAVSGSSNVTAVKATASSLAPIPVASTNMHIVGTSTAKTTPGTSLVIPVPVNTTQGDLILAFVAPRGNSTDIAAPSGWTKLVSQDYSASRFFVFGRTATASEPASYTMTFGTSGVLLAIGVTVRRGNTSTPVNAWTGDMHALTGTAITAPTATSTVNGSLIFRAAWCVNSGATQTVTWGSPSTELVSVDGISGSSSSILTLAASTQPTAGSTGTATATLSPSGTRLALTIAISPA